MKFFVSGKIGDEAGVTNTMKSLRYHGHEITFDWTQVEHLKPFESNIHKCVETSVAECNGVKNADVLIVMLHEKGVGMFVELGIALGCGIPVRVVTDKAARSMFFFHPLVKIVPHIGAVFQEFCKPL